MFKGQIALMVNWKQLEKSTFNVLWPCKASAHKLKRKTNKKKKQVHQIYAKQREANTTIIKSQKQKQITGNKSLGKKVQVRDMKN